MRKFLLIPLLFFCSVSFADTNNVDLTTIENKLDSLYTVVLTMGNQLTSPSASALKGLILTSKNTLQRIRDYINGDVTSPLFSNWESIWVSIDNKLSSVYSSLSQLDLDLVDAVTLLDQSLVELQSVSTLLSTIRDYTASLPRIEAYQQSLSLLVSNINQLVSGNLNINFPNPFNVNVQNINDINFNPAWRWQDVSLGGSSDSFNFASPFNSSGLDSTYDLQENSTISSGDTLGGSLGSINNNISQGFSYVTQWQSKNISAISNIYASISAYLNPSTAPTNEEIQRYNDDKEKIPTQSDINTSHETINTDSSTLSTDLDNLDGELGRLLPNTNPLSVAPILPSYSPSELQEEYTVANITPFEFGNTKSRGTTPLTISTRNTSSMFKGCRMLMTLIFWCAGAGLFMWGFRFIIRNFGLLLNTVTGGGLSEIQKGLVNISGNWGIDMPLDAIE